MFSMTTPIILGLDTDRERNVMGCLSTDIIGLCHHLCGVAPSVMFACSRGLSTLRGDHGLKRSAYQPALPAPAAPWLQATRTVTSRRSSRLG